MAQTEQLCPLTEILGGGHSAFSGVFMLPDFHVGPDGEKYVTRAQAAKIKGVAPATIDGWVRKDYLAPIPNCPPRHQLFRLADVDRAETTAYLAALRTSGSGKRVERHIEDAA